MGTVTKCLGELLVNRLVNRHYSALPEPLIMQMEDHKTSYQSLLLSASKPKYDNEGALCTASIGQYM